MILSPLRVVGITLVTFVLPALVRAPAPGGPLNHEGHD